MRWPYLVKSRRPRFATAFTLTSQVGYRPADLAVGEFVRRHSPFGGFQYFVGNQFVVGSTINLIPNPSAKLLRLLEAKSKEWARDNTELEDRREQLDDSFRYKRMDPVECVSLVRKSQWNAFSAFCDSNEKEDERLIAARQVEVTKLVAKHTNEEPNMSLNSFRPKKFEDFEIVDENNKVVGHVRIKPSGVLWAPTNAKVWYGVALREFAAFMEDCGKKQAK